MYVPFLQSCRCPKDLSCNAAISCNQEESCLGLHCNVLLFIRDQSEVSYRLNRVIEALWGPQAEQGSSEVAARDLKRLAEHQAAGSWDVLHAYLEHILPLHPSALCSSSTAANGHVEEAAPADDSDDSRACSSAWPSAKHLQVDHQQCASPHCDLLILTFWF